MKLKHLILLLAIPVAIYSCKQNGGNNGDTYTPPSAGTIVARAETAVKEDQLNKSNFTVRIITNEFSAKRGVYDIEAAWGFNTANSQFTMPRGGENLKPLIRTSNEPYTFIIGFHHGDDTTFYDYYRIAGNNGQMEMGYIKAYSFQ